MAFLLRYLADATFIGVVLLLNAVIGTIQEHGAERSAEALRKLVPERTLVLREGEQHEIESEKLVPGDVVLFEETLPRGHTVVRQHRFDDLGESGVVALWSR